MYSALLHPRDDPGKTIPEVSEPGSVTGCTEVLKTGSGGNDRIGRNTDPQRCILGKWGEHLTDGN